MGHKHMTILVDMDDTMECLVDAWCRWLNEKYGTHVLVSDVTDWDIGRFFPELSEYQLHAPLRMDAFWSTVRPRADAMKYMRQLYDEGYDVYVVTASDYRTIKPKFDYIINRYFPWISWNNVIISSKKQMIIGDVLIDDGIHNLVGGGYAKILITAPHNKNIDLAKEYPKEHIMRANSWEDVYAFVEKIKKKGNNSYATN